MHKPIWPPRVLYRDQDVVFGEMSLDQVFYEELANSSSPEFKNLSTEFCGAIKDALQKNSSEYGDKYQHCDVTNFRNGSIVVQYKVYYEFTTTIIIEETVQKDINSSLTPINSSHTQLSNFKVITTSLTITVNVETYVIDPITTSSTTTSTTAPATETTTDSSTGTTSDSTTSTTAPATETTTDSSTSTTAPATETTTDSSTETTPDSTTLTTAPVTVTTTDSSTSTTAPATETTTGSSTSTTAPATETTTDSSTETTPDSTTSTTAPVTVTTTDSSTSTTAPATETTPDSSTSTTAPATETTTDSSTETTPDSTTSTTAPVTVTTTDSSTETTPDSTTSTTAPVTVTTTDSSTSTTAPATETTTDSSTSTTARATETTTDSSTSTTAPVTVSTTESSTSTSPVTVSTTDSSTSTTSPVTVSTTDSSTSTTAPATVSTSDNSTSTTSPVTVSTTDSSTSTTALVTETTTDSSTSTTSPVTVSTTDSSTSTTAPETTATAEPVKYTADVHVSSIVATVGELTTSKACIVTPHGEWLQINVSVDSGGVSHVIGKLDYNQSFETPSSLDRFNASIRMNGDTVDVMVTLNLTEPTTKICSWDNSYKVYCSVIMNDTFPTKVVEFNPISVTAPMAEVSIDSKVHYNEGDQMTFNCTTKGDPNYSYFDVQLIKDSNIFYNNSGGDFGTGTNSDCSIDFNWVGGHFLPPLTSNQTGVIVRCVVRNTVLNKTKTAEKTLNVSSSATITTPVSETTTDSTTSTTSLVIVSTTDSSTSTTASVIVSTTDSSTSTTSLVIVSTTDSSTSTTSPETTTDSSTSTTAPATETTTDSSTSTTASVTETTTDSSTSTTAPATVSTTDSSTSTTAPVTTTDSSTSTTATATVSTTDSSTSTTAPVTTTDSSTSTTEPATVSTTDSSTSTTAPATTTTAKPVNYTADVHVSNIVATVGELTTSKACIVTPHGEWLQINVSVDSGGVSHVIGKLDYNQSFETPSSLDRFNASIRMNGDTVDVMVTLNLTEPTTKICSWNNDYKVYCSVIMNNTFPTKVVDFNPISVTAPMSEVSIDSKVHYNEGDLMTFNCTTKVDPDYSDFYAELIKDSNTLFTIPGPDFGTGLNTDCSIDFNWVGGPPLPLTPNQNGVIVRCVVRNTLLNKTKIAEKTLNVSSAGVAFFEYSKSNLTKSFQEIECIARSASSIFQEIILSKDGAEIAVMNSSGTASMLITNARYSVTTQSFSGDERLILRISSVECEDQGMFGCKMSTKNNSIITAPNMTFIVEGAKPELKLHPDIFEPFARAGLNHICSTEHTGMEERNNYLEVQIFKPNAVTGFRYSNRIAETEKMLDPTNNITYINITGTTAQFLLVSDWKTNVSCNNPETITFLLDLTMEFNNGTVKCVLKDDETVHSSVESRITVIPGNFCDGYEHQSIRKHPNNDCNSFVDCSEIGGKMYAVGNQCPTGQCMDFTNKYCVTCDGSFTCEEVTTPGPTTIMTTLPPGTRYVSCNDSTHSEGTSAIVKCVVLDNTFVSLNITFLPESSQGSEEKIAGILPDGTVQSQSRTDMGISTNFASSPMILSMTFHSVNCSGKGRYSITGMGTDSLVALSVETFRLNVISNLTAFSINTSPIYQEGSQIEFNCTATLDESHADIKAYYKRQSESSFNEIEGSTVITGRNDPHCLVNVVWKPSNLMIADGSFNNTDLKCSIMQWPFANKLKSITVGTADVAFDMYKIEANINSTVSAKCFARNVNAVKAIVIRRADNNATVASISLTNTLINSIDGVTVSYTNNSLTMSIAALSCWDEGYYTCTVVKSDDAETSAPAQLHIQPKDPPKKQLSTLRLDPDIKENSYDSAKVHTCTGDVGYPVGEGYLSITITNPDTNVNYSYDKKAVTDAMKTPEAPPLKFRVSLATGLSILIVEDDEPTDINCTRTRMIKFLLQVTRDWNMARIRCSVKTENSEIKETVVEDEIYVIPKSICDDTNGTDAYRPHEKIDGCKSYVRCYNYIPTGQRCGTNLCFDHGGVERCDWCRDVKCESEMTTTTEGSTELATTTIPPSTTPALLCPLQSCTSDSAYEGDTGRLSCSMNMSASYTQITVAKKGQALLVVYPNSTTVFSISEYADKYTWTLGSSSVFTIKNTACLDRSEYTFTVEADDGRTCSEKPSFDLKVKPTTPTLTIDYRWEVGKNQKIHTCSGDVGNPAGTLSLEIKNGTSGNYTSYTSLRNDESKFHEDNCSNTLNANFSIDFTSTDLQGHYIRCVADNSQTLQSSDTPPASDAVMINPLPANPCLVSGFYPYPGECSRYLHCDNTNPNVGQCRGTLCFRPDINACQTNCTFC
ncbi:serine-rich adhesin for platelets-like [Ostrea edulis]|uniref:serine-rich adhesin for platelets-like n=1 Tax=Ostrea edulis TaxID=37623 RepID=UPI0024AF8F4C|nr:serine-rich adhesin for platelets-like [Ostrea edulis]